MGSEMCIRDRKRTVLFVACHVQGCVDNRMGGKDIVIRVLWRGMGIRNDLTCFCCSRETLHRFIVQV